jgi:hypothetical protein
VRASVTRRDRVMLDPMHVEDCGYGNILANSPPQPGPRRMCMLSLNSLKSVIGSPLVNTSANWLDEGT